MGFPKGILIPFLNLWYPISCAEIFVNINADILESMLQQSKQLKGDDFAIWNIKNGVPILFGVNQSRGVKRQERHIILERIREGQEEWNLSYWIPKFLPGFVHSNNEQDNFTVAAYTMALDQLLNETSTYHYSRGSEGIIFGRDIEVLDTCLIKGNQNLFNLKFRRRRFVLLEEQNVVIIRQGFPLSRYLYKDNCAVFYTVRVYVFCGNGTISNKLRSAAHTLGNLVKEEVQKYNPDVGYIEIEHGVTTEGLSAQQRDELMEFYIPAGYRRTYDFNVPELADQKDPNPFIIRNIWNEQSLITLSKDTDFTNWYILVQKGLLFKSMLKTEQCHIVMYREMYHDSMFFLWIGTKSTIEDRIRAAIKVEQTMTTFYSVNRDMSIPNRMMVPVVVEGKEPLEFKAIFIDWIDEENHHYVESLVNTGL